MGIVIHTNMPGLNASNVLNKNTKSQQKSMQKLASGYKINSSADDASGLAISEKMRNKITALDTVVDSCEDGVNFLQTAEGNIAEIQDMMTRKSTVWIRLGLGLRPGAGTRARKNLRR